MTVVLPEKIRGVFEYHVQLIDFVVFDHMQEKYKERCLD